MFRTKRLLASVAATGALALAAAPATAQQADQDGLINVAVQDVLNNNNVVANVQVPVGIAANICGVSANVLAQQRRSDQEVTCTARGEGDATSNTVIRSLPRPFQP